MKSWSGLGKKIIIKPSGCCTLSVQDNGSEDNEIACLKPGKPLSSGLERFKVAMAETTQEPTDSFTELDIQSDPDLVIDSDRGEDEDVDIEKT